MCTYFEALLDHVALYFVEEIAVLLVDELVAVDAFRLVQIQADQVRHGLDRLWFGKQNALHIRHKRKLNKNIFYVYNRYPRIIYVIIIGVLDPVLFEVS